MEAAEIAIAAIFKFMPLAVKHSGNDEEEAKDLLQDVALTLLLKKERLEKLPASELNSYVARCIINRSIDRRRSAASLRKKMNQAAIDMKTSEEATALRKMIALQSIEVVKKRFALLRESDQRLVTMLINGFLYKEAAKVLNIPINTALANGRHAFAYLEGTRSNPKRSKKDFKSLPKLEIRSTGDILVA